MKSTIEKQSLELEENLKKTENALKENDSKKLCLKKKIHEMEKQIEKNELCLKNLLNKMEGHLVEISGINKQLDQYGSK